MERHRLRGLAMMLALGAVACTSSTAADRSDDAPSTGTEPSEPPSTTPPTEAPLPSMTEPPKVPALADVPPTTTDPPSAPATTPSLGAASTPYGLPVADARAAAWGATHAGYPASDIFVGCGALIVAPVNGVVVESRRVNSYDPAIDNPATRGGRSVTLIGDDGVRYYLAHFERIEDGIEPAARVTIGQPLGEMGQTGRASACHLHFGISPPCPGKEWSVRRGVVWPFPYLDDWRGGGQRSPVAEIEQWQAEHPSACTDAMADPHAPDS